MLLEPRIFASWLSFLARTAGGAGDGAHLWMFRWPDALAAESNLKRAMMNVSAKKKSRNPKKFKKLKQLKKVAKHEKTKTKQGK